MKKTTKSLLGISLVVPILFGGYSLKTYAGNNSKETEGTTETQITKSEKKKLDNVAAGEYESQENKGDNKDYSAASKAPGYKEAVKNHLISKTTTKYIIDESGNVSTVSSDSSVKKNSLTGKVIVGEVDVAHGLYPDTKKHEVVSYAEIERVVGKKPSHLAFTQDLLIANSKRGSTAVDTEKSFTRNWKGSQIKVNKFATQKVKCKTKFWSIRYFSYVYFPGDLIPQFRQGQGASMLLNRKAALFPDYKDSHSGKKASDELKTNWKKVSNPTEYDSGKDRQKAIAGYINKYGNPHYEWSRKKYPNYYEMHHMRPLEFGGTNKLSNFLPIPCKKHIPISIWFKSYSNKAKNPDPKNK